MRRLAGLLVVVVACGAPRESAPVTEERAPEALEEPGPEPPRALSARARARLTGATQTLATRGCDRDALELVRTLQRAHGDLQPLVEAQRLAFEACQDPVALAELLARTTVSDPSPSAQLQLGAAWVRAARYEQAVSVLEPLAQREGPRSQAAWLAGFALAHAGEWEKARPLLESARQHAGKDVSDAWLLIGLSKLHGGDVDGAIAELEAGVEAIEGDTALWTALSRAYATAGRSAEATRALTRALAARQSRQEGLRTQMWLAARAEALRQAAKARDVEGVEEIFDHMWPDAPTELRGQMLELRAGVYEKAGLHAKAKADRTRAASLGEP